MKRRNSIPVILLLLIAGLIAAFLIFCGINVIRTHKKTTSKEESLPYFILSYADLRNAKIPKANSSSTVEFADDQTFDLSNYYITDYNSNVHYYLKDSDLYYATTGATMTFLEEERTYGNAVRTNGTVNERHTKKKIAEHVCHFDYSDSILIYLTEDHQLYGFGSNANLLLTNGNAGAPVNEPILLMDDIIYARCSSNNIVALTSSHDVYGWGSFSEAGTLAVPTLLLSDAIYVTTGDLVSAAIQSDHSLWTWGAVSSGMCGYEAASPTTTSSALLWPPQKASDNVWMVWTGDYEFNQSHPEMNRISKALYSSQLTTMMQTLDGSMYLCGVSIGARFLPITLSRPEFVPEQIRNQLNFQMSYDQVLSLIQQYPEVSEYQKNEVFPAFCSYDPTVLYDGDGKILSHLNFVLSNGIKTTETTFLTFDENNILCKLSYNQGYAIDSNLALNSAYSDAVAVYGVPAQCVSNPSDMRMPLYCEWELDDAILRAGLSDGRLNLIELLRK